MFEQEKISQLLDILGNKNRRRIIDLLQNKPCFVTEISDKLSINPKAVIEHLAIMQKEKVIGSYSDDKRRKYYYLINDINFSFKINPREPQDDSDSRENLPLSETLTHLKSLMTKRQELMHTLEDVEKDIDRKMEELVTNSYSIFHDESEPEILLALLHAPLTPMEIADACGRPIPEITAAMRVLAEKGYIVKADGKYALSENMMLNG